jgi:hypothetical protein
MAAPPASTETMLAMPPCRHLAGSRSVLSAQGREGDQSITAFNGWQHQRGGQPARDIATRDAVSLEQ